MVEVYALIEDAGFEGISLCGIFSSKEKAEKAKELAENIEEDSRLRSGYPHVIVPLILDDIYDIITLMTDGSIDIHSLGNIDKVFAITEKEIKIKKAEEIVEELCQVLKEINDPELTKKYIDELSKDEE